MALGDLGDYGDSSGPWGLRQKEVMADVVVQADRDDGGSGSGQGCWLGQRRVARTRDLILRLTKILLGTYYYEITICR